MLKKIGLALLVVLIAIQFIPYETNESNDNQHHISQSYDMPDNISVLLDNACYNCHSNKSEYPWYAHLEPIGLWLNSHITDGKRSLNFSEFTNRPLAYQNHKLDETIELVESKEMPLESYTYFGLHPEGDLTESQRNEIIEWAKAQMDYLKATYPADSLVMKRRGPPPGQ
ncbi:heme-binding domain-containing protein [Algoriphagus halophytocola]|uniref:Heme-binding domain-containing protein n=1 Tax=Algoriphagus halophytocola TaxID=2991499 RepID=A0ABY6ML18_9BACT|nr:MULTISPECIES: heme-binding domain-containing protein [unclassified Algoriphagus]UZD24470.1 heme-binding domain-containing protein [Algoriphagus sp. TR-M5]WBL41834.1 heme-binding domain-containing protein [Algoriphagus sp. TR-M9]